MKTQHTPSTPSILMKEVQELLKPYETDLREACKHGIGALGKLLLTERYLSNDPRARATLINSAVSDQLTHTWANREGVRQLNGANHLAFVVKDKIVLRVKMVDENGVSSNYLTHRHKKYMEQLPLDDMPDALPRIMIGYHVDPFETTLSDLKVALPCGVMANEWVFSIIEPVEIDVHGQTVFLFDNQPISKSRIVPKKQKEEGQDQQTKISQ